METSNLDLVYFIRDAQFLSSDDSTWGDTELADFIRERFPDKSRWEI